MKSFKEYQITEGSNSNKISGMSDLIDAIKNWGEKYSIETRNFVWEHLTSSHGQKLVEKILRNPKTLYTKSEFAKLVEKK